jgi:iron complex outermembrane receptor protein
MRGIRSKRLRSRALRVAGWLAIAAAPLHAQGRELVELSLEELMNEPVTSVSKKETRLGDSATAITVITPEDLRRLGITNIPEALRLVPGFDVARIDAHHWAVSSRGFNQQYANMLLVLVDGRSVYTPTFGGVLWDMQDFVLADLERIEVIRGPGATLWGANAVNGVVNIITRHASETQGAVVSASVGSEDRPSIDARYGATAGESLSYRLYAKYFDREGLRPSGDFGRSDDWSAGRAGFRADWQPSPDRVATLQGDYFSMDSFAAISGTMLTPPFRYAEVQDTTTESFNFVGRYTQSFSDVSHLSVQAYFDSYTLDLEARDTSDVQLEHRFAVGDRHDLQWGVGYRTTSDTLDLSPYSAVVTQRSSTTSLYTAFLQDDIALVPKVLRLTLGAKLEYHDYTGLETQPSVRVLWTPAPGRTLWASASRAISTPPRFYNDGHVSTNVFQPPNSPPIETALTANPNLPSQHLHAYELGLRIEPLQNVSFELATFYNLYDRMYVPVQREPVFEATPVPHILIPLQWQAAGDYTSYGTEMVVNYRPIDQWRVTGSYSWLHLRGRPFRSYDHSSPAHQVGLQSYATLTPKLELNTSVQWVSAIDSVLNDGSTVHVPAYVRLDVGLVFHPSPSIEVGLWGQNLTDAEHAEINSLEGTDVTEVPRGVLFRAIKRF